VSPEQAVEVCRPWAEKLGITGELALPPMPWDVEAFDAEYTVYTDDRAHLFEVDAHRGTVNRYHRRRPTYLPAEHPPGDWLTPADAAAQRPWLDKLFGFLDLGSTRLVGDLWCEFASPTVATGNTVSLQVDPRTGGLASLRMHVRDPQVGVEPALSFTQCQEKAVRVVGRWPGVRGAQPGPWPVRRELYYLVASDALQVQRLVCQCGVEVERAPDPLGPEPGENRATVFVDAVNGECWQGDTMSRYPQSVDDERVPLLTVGDREWPGYVGPCFPPRMREGVPYLYVRYLQSLVWQGTLVATPEAATIQYHGHEWVLRADDRSATVDGTPREFEHPPLSIRGYLYLPPEVIHAITGWRAEYVRRDNTVYIYSHREGEAPPEVP
jgi:hypothetical protein